jgi:hypothetical protein
MLVFYVLLFGGIWPDVILRWIRQWWIRQWVCINLCANFGKSVTETLAMIRQAFREESMSHTSVFELHVQTYQDQKRQHSWWRGMPTKNLYWHAKQSVPHTTVIFYGDCMKIWKDFTLNFGDKRSGCCIMTTHQGILYPKQHDCRPPLTLLSSVSPNWR